jgi:hypothetical protein
METHGNSPRSWPIGLLLRTLLTFPFHVYNYNTGHLESNTNSKIFEKFSILYT